MALEVGAFEAKTQLSKLLELAQRGERIIITRRGVPVAQLTAVGREMMGDTLEVIEELKRIRGRTKTGDNGIRAPIEEGRQFVLDCSISASWCLLDEGHDAAQAILERLSEEEAVVLRRMRRAP